MFEARQNRTQTEQRTGLTRLDTIEANTDPFGLDSIRTESNGASVQLDVTILSQSNRHGLQSIGQSVSGSRGSAIVCTISNCDVAS